MIEIKVWKDEQEGIQIAGRSEGAANELIEDMTALCACVIQDLAAALDEETDETQRTLMRSAMGEILAANIRKWARNQIDKIDGKGGKDDEKAN